MTTANSLMTLILWGHVAQIFLSFYVNFFFIHFDVRLESSTSSCYD